MVYTLIGAVVLMILSAGAIYAYLESVKTADRLHSPAKTSTPMSVAPGTPPPAENSAET